MQFCTPIITTAGKDAGINVIFGQGTLEFNRIVIGNGRLTDIAGASDVASEVLDAELIGYESQGDSMLLRFTFNNKELAEGFDWTEYGVFAKYTPNDGAVAKTILYCYAYDTTDSPESVPAFTGNTSYYKAKFDLGVSVGNAEHVTVNLGDYTDFVAKEELEAHEANQNNPHGVTKAQIGLSEVENVSVNNARPTFTEASALETIYSGETTTSLWGKVKKAISSFISHLSANNPHGITPSKIGAAASTHNHSASEITTGTLSVERGGTGVQSMGKLASTLVPELASDVFDGDVSYVKENPNLNNLKTAGIYSCIGSTGPTNGPGPHALTCIVLPCENGVMGYIQIAIAWPAYTLDGNLAWIREYSYSQKKWLSWRVLG